MKADKEQQRFDNHKMNPYVDLKIKDFTRKSQIKV